MRYLAAYMLCQLGGKERPTATDIENILSSVGIEHDSARLKQLLDELSGKDVTKLIAEGYSKMASVPMGGGAPAATTVAAAPTAAAAAPTEPAKKEAPKKEEKESESDDDMGFGLFD
ncbi:Ribosomal protein lateral stalk subunit P2 [Paragonimus heterotremus]|uniref:Large ribosomal subunit protein P2 n=1 Tax=Paragonimus heterotremus TaxID=100268 RepID=A0A8J4SU45_9TREM|nr:Ribosomal protein lateral stalk subunit P2 [Paragonimus heterotremus]